MSGASQPAWRVREAGPDDAPALALVGAATFLDGFAGVIDGEAILGHCARVHRADAYADHLRAGAKAWLAEVAPGPAPIGFALLGAPDLPGAVGGDVELKRIYSLSRFHGLGVGAALMNAAVAQARGHRRLLLGVYAGNGRAIAFYRKHGFEPIGERRFDVGGHVYDDVVLARPLAA